MTLDVVRDEERNYDLMRSQFKGAWIFVPPPTSLVSNVHIPMQILSMMQLSSVRPVDTGDTPLTSSTGFLARTARNHTRHAPLQIVAAVALTSDHTAVYIDH